MLTNQILQAGASKWLVRQAVSEQAARDEIAMARCMGSVGSKRVEVCNGVETVQADVVRLNDDGSECQPN